MLSMDNDMKTIEERAKEYSKKQSVKPVAYNAYIAGAKEQKAIDKAIDIEKACKWLEKELQEIAVDEVKENFLENNFNIVLKSQVPDWLINFRKAMEE